MAPPKKYFTPEEVAEANRKRKAQWKRDNPEKVRLQRAADHLKRRDKIRVYRQEYRKRNRANQAEENRRHREKYREYHLSRIREWNKKNPNKTVEYQNRRRALKLGGKGRGVTPQAWARIQEDYGHRCAYCGRSGRMTRDHLVSLARGGDDTPDNCVPACLRCNMSKHDHSIVSWLARTGRKWLRKQLEAA